MKRRSVGGTSKGSALVVDVSRKVFIVKGGGALDRNLLFEQFFFSDSKAPPEERHNCGGRGLVGTRRGRQQHGLSTTGGSGHLPPAKPRKTFSAKGIEDHLHRASCQL